MTTKTNNFDTFLAISQWLTGFEAVELQGTGMAQTYFSTIQTNSPAPNIDGFLDESRAVLALAESDPDAAKARTKSHLMQNSSFHSLAKQIILMWYTGQWFADPSGNPNDAAQINAQSYIEALMWPTANVHPPGAKQPGYASWAELPTSVHTYNVSLNP